MKKVNLSKAQQKMIQDFCNMTGGSNNQAEYFLKRTNWNIQNSINLFFDQGVKPQQKQIKSNPQIQGLFDSLSIVNKQNQKVINEEKFAQFVQKYLKVDQENLVVGHILVNVMEVKRSGHITKQNFYKLFSYCGCDSPQNLHKYMKNIQNQLTNDKTNFRNMYNKTYDFYLIGKETTIEYQTAVELWKVFLKPVMPFYNKFVQYCQEVAKKPHRVHKDLWKMVYEFATTVNDVSQVKEDDGWPVFLDQFVEYLKDKLNT